MPSSPCHNPFPNLKGHCQKDIRKRIQLSLPNSIYGERMERHSTINLINMFKKSDWAGIKQGTMFWIVVCTKREKKNYGVKRIHSTKSFSEQIDEPTRVEATTGRLLPVEFSLFLVAYGRVFIYHLPWIEIVSTTTYRSYSHPFRAPVYNIPAAPLF